MPLNYIEWRKKNREHIDSLFNITINNLQKNNIIINNTPSYYVEFVYMLYNFYLKT